MSYKFGSEARAFKHGHATSEGETPTYTSWRAMLNRCQPCSKWRHLYFDRNIGVCERWKVFLNFFEDMGPRPEGMSLDRTNNSLGYFKENCRWATPTQQNRNRRSGRLITLNGETHLLIEWTEKLHLDKHTILRRIASGWSLEKALTTPSQRSKGIQ